MRRGNRVGNSPWFGNHIRSNITFVGLEDGEYTLVTLVANGDNVTLNEKTENILAKVVRSYNTTILENGEITAFRVTPSLLLDPSQTPEPEPEPDSIPFGWSNEDSPLPFNLTLETLLVIGTIMAVVIVGIVAYKLRKNKAITQKDMKDSQELSISDI